MSLYVPGQPRRHLDRSVKAANAKEVGAKEQSKKHYDKQARDNPLEAGDEVLILHPYAPHGWKGGWVGPFLIQERISPVSYKIQTPGRKGAVLHRNYIKHYVHTAVVNHVVVADRTQHPQDQLQLPFLPGAEEQTPMETAALTLSGTHTTTRGTTQKLQGKVSWPFLLGQGKQTLWLCTLTLARQHPSTDHTIEFPYGGGRSWTGNCKPS